MLGVLNQIEQYRFLLHLFDTYSAQGRSHISHLQPTFLSLDLFLSSERGKKCSSTDSHMCYLKIYQCGTSPVCKTLIISQHLKSVIVKCTCRHHFWLSCGLAADLEPLSKGQECTWNCNEISWGLKGEKGAGQDTSHRTRFSLLPNLCFSE